MQGRYSYTSTHFFSPSLPRIRNATDVFRYSRVMSLGTDNSGEDTHSDVLLSLRTQRRQTGMARRRVRRRGEAVDMGECGGGARSEEDELDGVFCGVHGDIGVCTVTV